MTTELEYNQVKKGYIMGRWTNQIKNRACELSEGYEEARDEAFSEELIDFLKPIFADNDVITYDDIQGFLDSFSFDEEGDWAMSKALSELDDIGDQQYEQMRDERYEQD